MPTSFANVQTQKMELTPMRVTYKGVDLGGTLEGVTVNIEYQKSDILADQSGSTVRDRRVSGLNITVETSLAHIQDKEIWKKVFPHAYLVTDGLGNKQMYFTSRMGDSDLANAGELILHPLSKDDADKSGDFKFFKAAPDAKSSIVYSPTEQAKLKIIWNIMPDDSVQPERFMLHGDPAIGLINASFAAPTFVGTGDGTISGISVVNGVTKTETITAVCIATAPNGGIFQVTGSLSGPLGNATVGVGFSSPVISFLINDGSTDFALNDTFTINTTASNYV